MEGPDKGLWIDAIKKEIQNFLKRNAWIKTSRKKMLAEGRKAIGTKHVFKIKNEHDGSVRYKDRIVMKGFMAIPGVDYTESFSPVVTDATTRIMITIYMNKTGDGWIIEMIDFEAAFLNSDIHRDIYVEYPKGMVELGFMTEKERQESVAKLGRSMYGSVDASLQWFLTLTGFLRKELKMKQSKADPCVFYKQVNGRTTLIMGITVDDSLLIGDKHEVEWIKAAIQKRFKITDLGKLSKHLGVRYDFMTDENGDQKIDAHMNDYEEEMIKKQEDYRGTTLKEEETPALQGTFLLKNKEDPIDETAYRSIVGKIMHWTRKLAPETANATRELSQHMKSPNNSHWKAVDRFIGYVKRQRGSKLSYRTPKEFRVIAYFDANYSKNTDDRKSVTGFYETIDGRCTISYGSNTQKTVSLSTTEAEYQACSKLCQNIRFTHQLVEEIMGKGFLKKPAIVYGDNKGANFLIHNSQVGPRTRHVDIRHHWIRDLQRDGEIDVLYRDTERMIADIGTKNTDNKTFMNHTRAMREGLVER